MKGYDITGLEKDYAANVFLVKYFLSLVILLGFIAFPVFFVLGVSGEFVDVDDVVDHQSRKGGLYSSEIVNLEYQYHLRLHRLHKADVEILGSSRVGTVSHDFFCSSFANLTGMLRLTEDLDAVYSDLVAISKPKILIVGLDHNWFHPEYRISKWWRRNNRTTWTLSPDMFFHVAGYIWSGKITGDDVKRLLLDKSYNIGLQAKLFGAGTDKYGVRHWGRLTYQHAIDKALEMLSRPNPSKPFFIGDSIDEARWGYYLSFLRKAREDGVDVVGYLTPLPPSVVTAQQRRGDMKWIEVLRQRVAALPNHYDLLDVTPFGITDADFIDEVHAGAEASRIVIKQILRDPLISSLNCNGG